MKIEVGETYKNGFGMLITIEAKSQVEAAEPYPYLGVYPDGSVGRFSEDGTAYGLVSGGASLVPNKIKKTGWIRLYKNKQNSERWLSRLFDTEEDAHNLGMYPPALPAVFDVVGVTKVEWEEEE